MQKRLKGMPRVVSSERAEQEALIRWVRFQAGRDQRLSRLFHVPNGGWRHPATAQAMRRAGVVRGVPDLLLPVPAKGHVGLAIEMKSAQGKLTPEQKDWLAYLESVGWATAVCKSFMEARQALESYLGRVEE